MYESYGGLQQLRFLVGDIFIKEKAHLWNISFGDHMFEISTGENNQGISTDIVDFTTLRCD